MITPHKSVGQNVVVVLRDKLKSQPVVKIYQPNQTINTVGDRFQTKNNNLRFYMFPLEISGSKILLIKKIGVGEC